MRPHSDDVGLAKELTILPPVEGLAKSKEEFVAALQPQVAAEVGETLTYTGETRFKGRVQVVALGSPQSRFLKLDFSCGWLEKGDRCGNQLTHDFQEEGMSSSAFATYFDTNNPLDALRVLIEKDAAGNENRCSHGWKFWSATGSEERAVTTAIVMDKIGTEGKAWFVHGPNCDLKRGPNWIIAEGWICRGKMGRIGVLVQAFTPESEVSKPKAEEEVAARNILRSLAKTDSRGLTDSLVWKTAEALARKSQLKGADVVRGFVADLLTVAGPVWVQTPEGPRQLGPTTCELGLTTAAKSLRERIFQEYLQCGKYVTGRQTGPGLTAGAEKMEGGGWVLRKGLLPSMDLSWLVIDNMRPHGLDDQIESRRDGVVTVHAIRNAELWARTRLKLLSNPSQSFDETLYKCTLLKVYDPKLVARFAFVLYTYGVSTDDRYKSGLVQPDPGDETLLTSVKTVLRANLSREHTFTVPEDLWPKIIDLSKKLEQQYGCEDIPLLLRSVPYKLSVVAYSFALLEGYEAPGEVHVKLAYEWLEHCARDIELDKYVAWWRTQHLLSDQDYTSIADQIEATIGADLHEHGGTREETYTYALVDYLAKNETAQRDELAATLSVDPSTVSRKVNLLKGLGVLRSDIKGYHFTAKGVRFFKRWFGATDSTHATSFRGNTLLDTPEKPGENGGITLETSGMSGISGTSQPPQAPYDEVGSCAACGETRPLRPDRQGQFLVCGTCAVPEGS